MHIYIYIYIHVHIYICYMYIYIYIWTYIHTYMYIYTFIYKHNISSSESNDSAKFVISVHAGGKPPAHGSPILYSSFSVLGTSYLSIYLYQLLWFVVKATKYPNVDYQDFPLLYSPRACAISQLKASGRQTIGTD